jgi:hypothetical protein
MRARGSRRGQRHHGTASFACACPLWRSSRSRQEREGAETGLGDGMEGGRAVVALQGEVRGREGVRDGRKRPRGRRLMV